MDTGNWGRAENGGEGMGKLRRITLRVLISLGVLLISIIGGLDYYFKQVMDIHEKIDNRVQAKIREYQIHPITYDQIPDVYREAVIATEDRRFWWDPGIDPIGILRAFIVDVEEDGYVEGGSTITQQLVDNTLLHHKKTLTYKIRQAFYAVGIYDTISKSKTFAIYANVIYFGHGAYGLYNAAEAYFGTTPRHLNSGELVMLAGIPNSPQNYDPLTHISLARQRESIVLENMVHDHMISKRKSEQIYKQPIHLVTH